MMHVQCFAIVLLASSALAQHGSFGTCPNPPVEQEFQLAPYLGAWYEIARYDAVFELASKCNMAHYSMLPNGHIKVVNTDISEITGKPSEADGEAYNPDPNVGAKLSVSFGNSTFSGTNYWIVSTDYTSYALIYSCQQFTPVLHVDFAWILSRTPTILSSTRDELLAKLESVGVPTKPFHFTKQGSAGNCTYPQ